MAQEFFRQPTTEEKKDFIVLKEKSPNLLLQFKKKAEDKQSDYFREKKPFCFTCARYDFLDWYEKNQKEMGRAEGFVDFDALKNKLPELEIYGDKDRFILVNSNDKVDPGKWKGDIPLLVTFNNYKCKIRGCNLSIEAKRTQMNNESKEMSNLQQSKDKAK